MFRRTVERFDGDKWIRVKGIEELHKGDIFRIFEPSGKPVVGNKRETIFYAISEPYWSDKHGDWSIDIGNPLH